MNNVTEYVHCSRPGCNATHPLDNEELSPTEVGWRYISYFDGHVCFYCPDCAPVALDVLVRKQGVKPLEDVNTLFGTWPGEVDDGFEEAIDELRHGKQGSDPSGPEYYLLPRACTEVRHVIEALGLSYYLGNVMKYVCRAGRKPGAAYADDLRKAAQYIQFELERIEAEQGS